jgi:hypothetical protein
MKLFSATCCIKVFKVSLAALPKSTRLIRRPNTLMACCFLQTTSQLEPFSKARFLTTPDKLLDLTLSRQVFQYLTFWMQALTPQPVCWSSMLLLTQENKLNFCWISMPQTRISTPQIALWQAISKLLLLQIIAVMRPFMQIILSIHQAPRGPFSTRFNLALSVKVDRICLEISTRSQPT